MLLLALAACSPGATDSELAPVGVTLETAPTSGLVPVQSATATPADELNTAATPLIGVTPRPTALPFFTPLPATATPPATPTPELGAAAGGPLVIDNVLFVDAVRDPTRNNGAIATLSVEFYGGAPPYTVLDESQPAITAHPFGRFERGGREMFWIHYNAPTTCDAALPRRVGIVSSDGQTAELEFWIDRVACSN